VATGFLPERLGGLEARRSDDATGFWGGGGSPANVRDFPVVLQWSGPSRDVRERLNRSKTHPRVALTGRGGDGGDSVKSRRAGRHRVLGVGQLESGRGGGGGEVLRRGREGTEWSSGVKGDPGG
jgi:hypothetical protein